jgi:predicted AlkP superfamily pyrophosphatase or phosphodiesterase
MMRAASVAFLIAVVATTSSCSSFDELVKMTAIGRSHDLRDHDDDDEASRSNASRPDLLIVGIDGMKRDVLYRLLEAGALPGLTKLLGGGSGGSLPHAYLDRSMLAPLPSITIVGWSTIFTGMAPAANGITGNEFFIREERRLAAPIPGSFEDAEPKLATYTDDYTDELLEVPTLYERLRADDPDVDVWVAVSQIHRGADRLLIAKRTAIVGKVYASAIDTVTWRELGSYEERDREILDNVIEEIEDDDHPVPDVLTLYVSGADSYAHVAEEGPDRALERFATGKLDEAFAELAEALDERGELADRYVVVVADHGHSPVPEDGSTLLTTAPRGVLKSAGFRVRPFALEVDANDDFSAVLAYQGPMAYVYVADRSTCAAPGTVCDWKRPPRFEGDVIPAAEAYFQSNRRGAHAPEMRGTLDMILVRRPRPFVEEDLPFEVYVGGGRRVAIDAYLRAHPHPRYVDFAPRLRELTVGRYGERAGDLILVASNGTDDGPAGRYYFNSGPQRSVHGSASRQDAEIPLILAHPGRSSAELQQIVTTSIGAHPLARQVTDLALSLRQPVARSRP